MNKAYKAIWNNATGTCTVVQENAKGRGKTASSKAIKKTVGLIVSAGLGLGFASFAPSAMAGSIINCSGSGYFGAGSVSGGGAGSGWNQNSNGYGTCSTGAYGVSLSEDDNYLAPGGNLATIMVGKTNSNEAGVVTLYGPSGINLQGDTVNTGTLTMSNQRILSLGAGTVSASSTDAVNGSQLFGVASSAATALGGGAAFDPVSGTVTAPTYVLQNGGTTHTVAEALSGLDSALTDANANIGKNSADISSLGSDVSGLGTQMTQLGPQVTSIDSRVSTNEANIVKNANEIGTINSQLSSLESGTSGFVQQAGAGADL
ncbi:hypothetical protein BH160DRAFT_7291, partial [Burkholderia sp. H160]